MQNRPENIPTGSVVKYGRLGCEYRNRSGCARDAVVVYRNAGRRFPSHLPGNLKVDLLLAVHIIHGEDRRGRVIYHHRNLQELSRQGEPRAEVDSRAGCKIGAENGGDLARNNAAANKARSIHYGADHRPGARARYNTAQQVAGLVVGVCEDGAVGICDADQPAGVVIIVIDVIRECNGSADYGEHPNIASWQTWSGSAS